MSKYHAEIQLEKEPGLFSQIPKIWSMTYYAFLASLRNPATFAFGFIFPIVFISVFGLISNGNAISAKIGIPNGNVEQTPVYQALNNIAPIEISRGDEKALREKLIRGQIDGLLTIQTNQNNSQIP